jgi:Zn-dependent M16 (insulinase) family peptidase
MNYKNFLPLATLLFFFTAIYTDSFSQNKIKSFSALTQNEVVHGFKTTAVYLNDEDKPMGGRFVHVKTGFTLDLLQIESVPQTFIYVNTFPVSDKGEPHTQEHLLITKGNKGHELNTREGMSLARSNAFTNQLYTAYDFYTGAGVDVFYSLFEGYLDALLYPDYTDEEVSREVRNWGVSENPDKTLRIEEKGSVYNEMSTTENNPYRLMFDTVTHLVYGNAHPLSYNAGGSPAGIRELTAAEISAFHDANYYLGNMGAIVSVSKKEQPGDVLNKIDQIVTRLNSEAKKKDHVKKILPPTHPAAEGEKALIRFPSENAQQPGYMLLAYPATLKLTATEDILLSNFLSVFAGDATTNLYKIFVNSKTRDKDFDAQGVWAYDDANEGQSVFIGLTGIKTENLTEGKADYVRQLIIQELNKIASYKDHSPELIEFNKRFENGLISAGRGFAKFVNSPPKFGFRNTGGEWYDQLNELNKIDGFQKSVILKPQFEEVKKLLSSGKNIWKTYLGKWGLTTATPYAIVCKADPSLIAQSEVERKDRTEKEIAHLKNLYNLSDDQAAIRRYKEVYDSNTTVLEKMAQSSQVKFIDNPPLTIDDQLDYKQLKLTGNVPLLASVFNNMTSTTTGIAIDLHGVPQDKLLYLALLPELITRTGIIKNGKAISYEDMSQMMQQQILGLQSYYSTNGTTGRAELVLRGAGNNSAEAQRAVEWMNDVLAYPYWRKENLSRIQDLVEQELSGIRKTMQGAEESWVLDPSDAYRFQDQPLHLATESFLTRTFNIFRLKWMLKDAGDVASSGGILHFLSSLSDVEANRAELKTILKFISDENTLSADFAGKNKQCAQEFLQLPSSAKLLAKDAAADLIQMLNEIPDTSLGTDWKFVCNTMQHDLAQAPAKTLDDLNSLRAGLLKRDNVRFFVIGSENTEQKIVGSINKMVAGFDVHPTIRQRYSSVKMINERVKSRMHTEETPVFAGLINPDSPTGVFINSAPLVTYADTTQKDLLKYLAAELYGGGGKQSVYTKSTGAGLSYSTGVGASPVSGTFRYYAERTPLLPQTLRFVIDEIKRSPFDSTMLDYVVSLAVGGFRSASDYEVRGEAMANDLEDGFTPDKVKQFRLAILKLRKQPGVIHKIYQYKDQVYEKILPGYGIPSREVKGGNYFVIGPEKQMAAYEAYLKSVEGNDAKLYRLYPRDFWMAEP